MSIKVPAYTTVDIGGSLITDNGKKIVRQNRELDHVTVLSGALIAKKSTEGHIHHANEEVYIFSDGVGEIHLRYPDEGQGEIDNIVQVSKGSVVLIEKSVFHRIINTGDYYLRWVSVYNGKRREAIQK